MYVYSKDQLQESGRIEDDLLSQEFDDRDFSASYHCVSVHLKRRLFILLFIICMYQDVVCIEYT